MSKHLSMTKDTFPVYLWEPGRIGEPRKMRISIGSTSLEVFVFGDGGTKGKVTFGATGMKHRGLPLWATLKFTLITPPTATEPAPLIDKD